VIITTKRGQSGAPRIEFNTSVGVSSILKKLEVMNAAEYKAALTSYGLTSGNYGSDVDAMDAILRTGISSNYNLAITGGNENGRYRISGGYQDQQGIVKQSGFKKYTGSIVGSYKFFESKRFSVDYSLTTAHTTTLGAPISNNAGFQGSLVGAALQWNPTHPLRKPDGSIFITPQFGNSSINPLALLEAFDARGNLTTILGSISPSFKLTNDLEYKMLYSVNYSTGNQKYELKNWINIQGVENNGQAGVQNNISVDQQFTHTLNYNKAIGNLNLSAVAGYEYLKFNSTGSGIFGTKFVDYKGLHYYDYMQNVPAANLTSFSFRAPISELQSYFARASLNYKDKYLLTGTFRVDGSTRFGANNKYGYFPSIGAAWNINNEDFMKDSKIFSNLKLRLGWGQTGNQEFTRNDAALGVVNIGRDSAQIRDNFQNQNLKWETNTTTNIGLDFSILDSRINGSVDYYVRKTTDPIFQRDIIQPGPLGQPRYFDNLPASVINSGFEVSLNATVIKKKDITWNVGVNTAFQKNEVKDLLGSYATGALSGQGSSGATVERIVNGQPLNVYYLRRFEGLDKTSGQSIYTDDGNTLFYSGSPNPTMLLGITTDVSYKNFGFVLNMNGAFGHYLFNETNMNVVPIGNLGTRNIAKSLVGGSVKEAISNAIAPSTRFLEKGNYLKAANATITYRIGNIGKVIKGATLSLTGQNLFVITKYSGFDPEVNVDKSVNGIPSAGIEYIPYPSARNILLGVRFEF
ncbi:MAG: SusC/RagA family TonB-linked outer membrane protein, partial [Flavihumibacter sp.]|nr:SusC/RagA family TonB-linked outer membrane protein [Flavihumibacter sp.]